MSIKKDLLERAAENAYQNQDPRLASALYDQIERIAAARLGPSEKNFSALKKKYRDMKIIGDVPTLQALAKLVKGKKPKEAPATKALELIAKKLGQKPDDFAASLAGKTSVEKAKALKFELKALVTIHVSLIDREDDKAADAVRLKDQEKLLSLAQKLGIKSKEDLKKKGLEYDSSHDKFIAAMRKISEKAIMNEKGVYLEGRDRVKKSYPAGAQTISGLWPYIIRNERIAPMLSKEHALLTDKKFWFHDMLRRVALDSWEQGLGFDRDKL